jgi:hypothetical protein
VLQTLEAVWKGVAAGLKTVGGMKKRVLVWKKWNGNFRSIYW